VHAEVVRHRRMTKIKWNLASRLFNDDGRKKYLGIMNTPRFFDASNPFIVLPSAVTDLLTHTPSAVGALLFPCDS
jgi:hypothetical protein